MMRSGLPPSEWMEVNVDFVLGLQARQLLSDETGCAEP